MNKAIIIALLLATSLVVAADDAGLCYSPCAAGTKSDAGNGYDNGNGGGCSKCPAGTYSTVKSSTCLDCAAGFYSANEGTAECTPCVAGKYSNTGAKVCDITTAKCPVGQYSANGYDIDGQGNGCTLCEANTYTNTQGTVGKCTTCQVDKTTDGTGKTSCTVQLKKCPVGTYSISASGYDTDGNQGGCTPCAQGTYTNTEGTALKCTTCQVDKTTDGTGKTSCTVQLAQCPVGTFSPSGWDSDGQNKGNGCTPCPKNTYTNTVGTALKCTTCQVDKTTDGTGKTSCTVQLNKCPVGNYSVSASGYDTDGNKGGCIACPVGTYTNTPGTALKCPNCPDGQWVDTEGNTQCKGYNKCPAGKFSNTGGYNINDNCASCPAGQYSAAGATNCTQCAAGTFNEVEASTNCGACKAGTWSGVGSTSCNITTRKCHAGYKSGNGYDTDQYCTGCVICPLNTYSTQPASTTCTDCTNNRTAPAGSTVVTACVCPGSSTGENDGVSECSTSSMLIKFSLILLGLITIF